jgi:hypothetical protein
VKYLLVIGMTRKRKCKPTLRDINIAIDSLDANSDNPFIILEPSEAIENTNFIQVLCHSKANNDINHYLIEIQKNEEKGFRQYKYITTSKIEVRNIFKDYFLSQKSPIYDSWEEITDKVINQKKYSDMFFVYELAKDYYRNDKEIYNCYGYCHGNIVDGIPVFQAIAEAIILLKDVVNSSNQQGDIYFSENKRNIFLDIKIPANWKEIKISGIRGLLSNDKIDISCLDYNNNHIISDVSPITTLERLLACFMLIFAEKILSDEQYLYMALDFFFLPTEDKFKKVYSVFLDKPKHLSYFITYEDDDSFDLSNFTAFSSIYEIFKTNKINETRPL